MVGHIMLYPITNSIVDSPQMVGYIPSVVTSMGFLHVFRLGAVYNATLDALAHEPQKWATWPA